MSGEDDVYYHNDLNFRVLLEYFGFFLLIFIHYHYSLFIITKCFAGSLSRVEI